MSVLGNRTYRRLFVAQVVALAGSGLATVALGLLAHRLAGGDAGLVLGVALAIKMVAYVFFAPLATALAERLPRRGFLVAMDVVRAVVALALPFVTEVWQVYALIVVLQAASASFTPTFQATIPSVLPDEEEYTRALSLSRLAYELESLLSPVLAAALLTVVEANRLFVGTAIGFAASAALVLSVVLPKPVESGSRSVGGLRVYLATPRLRALVGLNLAAAAAGSMVLVNTVVVVREELGLGDSFVALALGTYGAGSILAALLLPRVLSRLGERHVMLGGAGVLVFVLTISAFQALSWTAVLGAWAALGLAGAAVQTPIGRLVRRSAEPGGWPGLFAAQFTVSHGGWLLTYLLAGSLGAWAGMSITLLALAVVAAGGLVFAARVWPAHDPSTVEHVHDNLAPDDPHLMDAVPSGRGWVHAHEFAIDRVHPRWPQRPE
ncbi:MFS transporter [Allokutzneria albata]|uniref:Predicted arabinose efflux permease, MFS family n=1 Tax=Allokutzneria albata TaxID=211114 RepID=A0A1G9XFR4_ALLAB|nr:MFS transporter [Allokutzneria albata]SDM95584.1 Predicted arabinose efflux permease, MFS family [Allokutzneria albata]